MKRRKRVQELIRSERGAVTVLIAAVLTFLMIVGALVIDVGLAFQERRQLQSACDAAALAAAHDLAEGATLAQAEETARSYVLENSSTVPETIEVSFPSAEQVKVKAVTEESLFFARVFHKEKTEVAAASVATYGLASRVRNLVPILVPIQFVSSHTGEENAGSFELGSDRPLDPFLKTAVQDGDVLIYTVSYINSSSKIKDVTITDPLVAEVEYVAGSATGGGVYNAGTRTVRWSFSSVLPDDKRIVEFSVQVVSGSPSKVKNTAYLDDGSGKPKAASVTGGTPQKGFFWLCDFNAGSGGVPAYADWIENGYPEEVSIGMVANGEGMKASLKDNVLNRIASDSSVVLPLYDYTEKGGSPGQYHIVGFAEFVITGADFSGNPKSIAGYFTNGTVVSGAGGESVPADFGINYVRLIE